MKKLMMMALVAAALSACQSKANQNQTAEADSLALAALPVTSVAEVYEGTLPTAQGKSIQYLLTLCESTDGIDTTYTLDMTYLDPTATGSSNEKTGNKTCNKASNQTCNQTCNQTDSQQKCRSTGKKTTIHKIVNQQPKTAMQLTPNNGEAPVYFVIVNDTTLRLVNDSLQESVTGIQYDLYKVK